MKVDNHNWVSRRADAHCNSSCPTSLKSSKQTGLLTNAHTPMESLKITVNEELLISADYLILLQY
jgi:hypothetical protein